MIELELMFTGNSDSSWNNVFGFTINDGGTTNAGDRMPIMSVRG